MIRTSRAHLQVEALTDSGVVGKNNEDRYAVSSFLPDEGDQTPVLFAVISDGIGGHRGGEVAAELAVNHIMQAVAASNGRNPRWIIERAVEEASDAIAAHSAADENLKGMGATCACAWIIGDLLYTAYVGDSRMYLLRGGRIQQLTTDHTLVQEAIDRGILTPELAREHPNVHVIRRYLGSPVPPDPDFRLRLFDGEGDHQAEANQGLQILPNDILLMCTDGLTDLVWNDEILETIRLKGSLKDAARALIDLANQRGGHDNITVILIGAPSDFKLETKQKADWLPWVIGGVAGVVVGLAFASILTLSLLRRTPSATATPVSPALTSRSTLTFASPTPLLPLTPSPEMAVVPESTLPITPTYTPWPTNTVMP